MRDVSVTPKNGSIRLAALALAGALLAGCGTPIQSARYQPEPLPTIEWAELGEKTQRVLRPHRSAWARLPESERRRLVLGARRWDNLTEAQRLALVPAHKASPARAAAPAPDRGDPREVFESLPDEDRAAVVRWHGQFANLDAERKARVQAAFERARALPSERQDFARDCVRALVQGADTDCDRNL